MCYIRTVHLLLLCSLSHCVYSAMETSTSKREQNNRIQIIWNDVTAQKKMDKILICFLGQMLIAQSLHCLFIFSVILVSLWRRLKERDSHALACTTMFSVENIYEKSKMLTFTFVCARKDHLRRTRWCILFIYSLQRVLKPQQSKRQGPLRLEMCGSILTLSSWPCVAGTPSVLHSSAAPSVLILLK